MQICYCKVLKCSYANVYMCTLVKKIKLKKLELHLLNRKLQWITMMF